MNRILAAAALTAVTVTGLTHAGPHTGLQQLAQTAPVTRSVATTAATEPRLAPVNGSAVLARGIAAHGGLSRWQSYGTLSFTLLDFPLSEAVSKPNRHTTDLVSRDNRVDGTGFTVAVHGEKTWVTPNAEALGLPPRFYTKGSNYFVLMPFVFADPGITAVDAAPIEFRGRTYNQVVVNYGDKVGDVKDDYVLLFDQQTGLLAAINHSVNEAGIERVTWTFDQWQDVGGLKIPAVMSFSPGWNPQSVEPGKSARVTEASVDRNRPAVEIYSNIPAGAVVIEGE